jgi:LruC domain-containing protein
MRNQRWLWRCIGLLSVVALLATSCGGGSSTINPLPPGDPAPVVNPPAGGNPDLPQTTPIQGIPMTTDGKTSDAASLGTNPAYSVTEVVPTSFSGSGTSRASSALDPGESYAITNATVTPANITDPALVNFNASGAALSFNEGTSVNLWIKYETNANTTFHWTWTSTVTNYSVSADHTDATAGVHTAYMTMLIPLDPAVNPLRTATFTCTFGDKTGSVVVIPPSRTTVSIDFTIKDVPIDDPIIYPPITGGAYMLWEDLLVNSDYDYNDFVAGLSAKETRRKSDGKVIQIAFTVKAIARGAGYDSDWQFNMDSAFPGATCTAYIQQYAYNGTAKGTLKTWKSTDGVSIPVLTSNATQSLPHPADDSFATNVTPNTTWVNGDYAAVTIVFDNPLTIGTYTPIPYKPQLRVHASSTNIYLMSLWTRRGDPVDSNKRPLGFVVPGNFAWPCEGRTIWTGYPRFNNWVTWVNDMSQPDANQPKWWLDTPVYTTSGTPNVYRPSIFKGNPPSLPISYPAPS